MADFKTATTVGARVAALREARGFATAKDLADAIASSTVTEARLLEIESGADGDLNVALLLNVSWVLRVSPAFILAPLGSPHEHLDLPDLIPDVRALTVAEFDAWVSGIDGIYRPITADEHSERAQLEALRELLRARREASHYEAILELHGEDAHLDNDPGASERRRNAQQQLDNTHRRMGQLEAYLGSGGWIVDGDRGPLQ
jgi:hypothetical protein